MGISRGNGARPRLTLEIRWATSRVLRILGGPGRNRPGPRMADPISSLNSEMKVFAYYLIVIKTSSW
jgi:hypothetical protein